MNQQFIGKYPNILAMIDLVMSISPTSAEAERGFSLLKLAKTKLRTNLNQVSLNNCLGVKLLSKPISDYHPTEAV